MVIKHLKLTHFRNYEKLNISFPNKGAIFIGNNGQGKTNIIESIYLLSIGQSHRTKKDQELISWGQEYFYCKAVGEKKEGSFENEVLVNGYGKKVKVNGRQTKRVSELMGNFYTVIFSPEDLYLVKGSSSLRRKFMDKELSQVDPVYKNKLLTYHKILKRRNFLLKHEEKDKDGSILQSLTEQMAQEAEYIIEKRRRFSEKITLFSSSVYDTLTGHKESLSIAYKPSAVNREDFMNKSLDLRLEEKRRGMSLIGPHRDDLYVAVDQYDVRKFGSQGQQRSAVLSMKIAEIEFIRSEVEEYPILLLDDVMSELDESRKNFLMDTIQDIQIFITTTHLEEELLKKCGGLKIYQVKDGTLSF